MKTLSQCLVCKGQFKGGEIEPGTFHVQNSSIITPPPTPDAHCISNSEAPSLIEVPDDFYATAKDGPVGQ